MSHVAAGTSQKKNKLHQSSVTGKRVYDGEIVATLEFGKPLESSMGENIQDSVIDCQL